MKTELSFFEVVKFNILLIFKRHEWLRNMMIEECQVCRGKHFERNVLCDGHLFYEAEYTCKDCGSTCTVHEYWKYPEVDE